MCMLHVGSSLLLHYFFGISARTPRSTTFLVHNDLHILPLHIFFSAVCSLTVRASVELYFEKYI